MDRHCRGSHLCAKRFMWRNFCEILPGDNEIPEGCAKEVLEGLN